MKNTQEFETIRMSEGMFDEISQAYKNLQNEYLNLISKHLSQKFNKRMESIIQLAEPLKEELVKVRDQTQKKLEDLKIDKRTQIIIKKYIYKEIQTKEIQAIFQKWK